MMAAILARFAPYKLIAELIVIGGLFLYGADKFHEFLLHERGIGAAEVQKKWDAQKAEDERVTKAKEADWNQRLQDANKNANQRDQVISTLAVAAGNADNRLRDALAAIRAGVPTASPETLGKTVTTLSAVLQECTGRYRELAKKADGHVSDVKTSQEAWPSDQPPAK